MNRREAIASMHEEIVAIRRAHPDWPICRCRYPINPAALVGGFTTHPSCDRRSA